MTPRLSRVPPVRTAAGDSPWDTLQPQPLSLGRHRQLRKGGPGGSWGFWGVRDPDAERAEAPAAPCTLSVTVGAAVATLLLSRGAQSHEGLLAEPEETHLGGRGDPRDTAPAELAARPSLEGFRAQAVGDMVAHCFW